MLMVWHRGAEATAEGGIAMSLNHDSHGSCNDANTEVRYTAAAAIDRLSKSLDESGN